MTFSLYNTDLNIIRTTGKGYHDENEDYVAGQTEILPIKCNIQPYREGTNSFNTEVGNRTMDAIKIYTTASFQADDEHLDIVGDQVDYKGRSYYCKDLEQWDSSSSGFSLIGSYNLGYFYRKDVQ